MSGAPSGDAGQPPISFGTVVPNQGPFGDAGAIRELVQTAEDLGFDTAWFGDHVVVPGYAAAFTPANWYEALTCCLVGLGATSTLRLGTDVLVLPYRHPVLLAAQVATAHQLSAGRLILGVGVGFLEGEFGPLGAPPFAERGAVTDEFLDVVGMLLAADTETALSYDGRWVHFEDIRFGPTPSGRVPIWVGGNAPAAWRRAARHGSGWHPLFPTPEQYAIGRRHILDQRGGADGFTFSLTCPQTTVQDPAAPPARSLTYADVGVVPVDYAYAPGVPVAADGRPRFIGSPEEIAADVADYVAAGVQQFTLRFWTVADDVGVADVSGQMERFMAEVAPKVRESRSGS